MKLLDDAVIFISEEEPPPNFQSLTELPLLIMIGLTGVGKSTVVKLLPQKGVSLTVLPNRRQVADNIIARLQQEDGEPVHPVTDRVKRFEYTARYRTQHPGGLAHALSQLMVDPAKMQSTILFDGLRGLDEVQHAVAYFPKARFIILDAPDTVRLTRLLKRSDTFDTTTVAASLASQNLIAAFMGVPDIEAIFNEEQLRQIARMVRAANLSTHAVIKKITIIVEERRNYDSSTARVHLTHVLSPEQVLVVDTSNQSADEAAQRVADWLGEVGSEQ